MNSLNKNSVKAKDSPVYVVDGCRTPFFNNTGGSQPI